MPVTHVGLTVSHLPTAVSFFLATLQPLGYRYIGQWGPQIGFGLKDADFFLTQEMPGMKAGGGHVTFAANSKAAVHEFFASAIEAGATPHGKPAQRYGGDTCFNAAVLDFDGNSVEVVYHEPVRVNDGASTAGSHALTWRDHVPDDARSVSGKSVAAKSVVSVKSIKSAAESAAQQAVATRSIAGSKAGSVVDMPMEQAPAQISAQEVLATLQRSLTGGAGSAARLLGDSKIEMSTKTLAGTLIGAAAGAAVAYAMCKSEEDSARAEREASIIAAARMAQPPPPQIYLTYPSTPSNTPAGSHYSSSMRAIDGPLAAYRQPLALEYAPSKASTQVSVTRSARRPSVTMEEQFADIDLGSTHSSSRHRSHHAPSRAASHAASHAPSTKSRSSRTHSEERNESSHRPPSRAKSEAGSHGETRARSEVSKHSSSSRRSHRSHSSKSRAASQSSPRHLEVLHEYEVTDDDAVPPEDHAAFVDENDELESVAPSDSVSCAGSRRSKRSKSKKSHSSTSSRHGEKSEKGSRASSRRSEHSVKHDGVSESGSVDTITPRRYRDRSVASLPNRGISPAFVTHDVRTVASYCA